MEKKTETEYVLGNSGESYRLDYQSQQQNYNPLQEINRNEIILNYESVALDAGCGTGIFARHLLDHNKDKNIKIFAIDSSSQRIDEARCRISSKESHLISCKQSHPISSKQSRPISSKGSHLI